MFCVRQDEKMDESSKQTKKSNGFETIISAINVVAMGAGITAAIIASNKSKTITVNASKIEKSVGELNSKFDKISEQLKSMQTAKIEVPISTEKDGEKKQEPASIQQQPKHQKDVIYVRKSSEFSFYN